MLMDVVEIQKLLPHRYPFLMVDGIVELERLKRIVGIKNVTINEAHFQGHFPGAPVMPTRYARPVNGKSCRRISSASRSRFSIAETAREIARTSPARTCSAQFSIDTVIATRIAASEW